MGPRPVWPEARRSCAACSHRGETFRTTFAPNSGLVAGGPLTCTWVVTLECACWSEGWLSKRGLPRRALLRRLSRRRDHLSEVGAGLYGETRRSVELVCVCGLHVYFQSRHGPPPTTEIAGRSTFGSEFNSSTGLESELSRCRACSAEFVASSAFCVHASTNFGPCLIAIDVGQCRPHVASLPKS